MATIKELMAMGKEEIDLDCDVEDSKGRGKGMAPYCGNRVNEPTLASLFKLSKAESLVLDARPVKFVPPPPDVAAYIETLNGNAHAARKSFQEYKQDMNRLSYTKIRHVDVVHKARLDLAKTPDLAVQKILFYKAIIAWYSSPNSQ